jgi:hypothetical protein
MTKFAALAGSCAGRCARAELRRLGDAASATAVHDRWKNTRMANVVRDRKSIPGDHPRPTKPDPLLTFTKDQIAWVYGSKWAAPAQNRRRLLPARRAVGRHAQAVASVSGRERHRLVDEVLSGWQQHAADERAL